MIPYSCILHLKSDKVTWKYPIEASVDSLNID